MPESDPTCRDRTREHLPVEVHADAHAASGAVAAEIAALIRVRAAEGRRAVLGLATGSTPLGVYAELVRLHRAEGLSFRNVVTFNLDEYWPMDPADRQSYHRFMAENLFEHVDVEPASVHIPDGRVPQEGVGAACAAYERAIAGAGGIDVQVLGIGRSGHVGFNEPGSSASSRTRLITLDRITRMDAASDFFGEWNVPRRAVTMGVGTILEAKRILILAFGEHKAAVVRRAVEGEVTAEVAASFLQRHANVKMVLDPAAAAELTRFRTPWLVGREDGAAAELEWDEGLVRKAVIWLAQEVRKPILKLTDEDYNEHGLSALLTWVGRRSAAAVSAKAEDGAEREVITPNAAPNAPTLPQGGQSRWHGHGSSPVGAYDINIEVFRSLQRTITGWPGGKPGRPRFVAGRGVSEENGSDAVPKRIVVFSPHPDDDVISMGGTLIRLCEQGHEVHVAYQTSGNIAVFDDDALRHVDFIAETAAALGLFDPGRAAAFEENVRAFVRGKKPGQEDSAEVRTIKTLIRRTEAAAAARYSGVAAERIHHLDMPFYETGGVKKKPLGEEDCRIVVELLERVRPHMIYAAGDLSDPHGTHRVCLAAVFEAVRRVRAVAGRGRASRSGAEAAEEEHLTGGSGPGRPSAGSASVREDQGALPADGSGWARGCELWLYRGAWQEWAPHEIDMAVPLSPSEVERKRLAIFKHQSQKDMALFPGPWDTREFWQRAEARNRATAEVYDRLGLPEYQAMEGFVMWRG